MLTVLIPTADRASMLRTALQSVADQTAVSKIDRIVVSENGGTRKFEEICARFPSLPITPVFRSPGVTPLEHGRMLMNEYPDSDLTAILHDDDWWAPTHIECALKALEANPDAAGYGAGNYVVSDESSMLNCNGNLFPWFGAGYPRFAPWWKIARFDVLLAEMLGTLFHYSTTIARTRALREATSIFDLGNTFDNDRMLLFALSSAGSLLFNPTPQAFVRNHGVHQDSFLFDGDAQRRHMCQTTRWIIESSGQPLNVVVKTFIRRMSECPQSAALTLKALATREWCLPELKRSSARVEEPAELVAA
jgi:glycosyltransferase involved in cell wall biosynthesis